MTTFIARITVLVLLSLALLVSTVASVAGPEATP
jgi:hypothetical protein